jgi:nitrite reductase/ring-hydroxylating ferredoxin subunit
MMHTVRRTDIPENGMITLERGGRHFIIANVDGDVVAFVVSGPAAERLERSVIAQGRLCCPLHGWPIDPEVGRCGTGEFCRYEPLSVAVEGPDIRVTLPGL